MKIFVAASYSSHVDYATGEVFPEYKAWLEENLSQLESFGHNVFCALRADQYRINDENPAQAFKLDMDNIDQADGLLALVNDKVSAGVQTELGVALAQRKPVVIARLSGDSLTYFNQAIVLAGQAKEVTIPFSSDPFAK